jgi:hypothetical protein
MQKLICSKCNDNFRASGSSQCNPCINARKRKLRAEKKVKRLPAHGSGRKVSCNSCGKDKESNYMNDSLCKLCRSDENKKKRAIKRAEKGLPPVGSGRSPLCTKCKNPKESGRENESWCKSCRNESVRIRKAVVREEKGLLPFGSGRKIECCKCGKVKENRNSGYCNACNRELDNNWRLKTGITKKHRTGLCQCGNPFRKGYKDYCAECKRNKESEWRAKNPKRLKEIRKKADEIQKSKPDDWLKKACRRRTRTAVANAELTRKPCEVCGDNTVDAHHDDYTRPLDVRWLCRKHHVEHHRKD